MRATFRFAARIQRHQGAMPVKVAPCVVFI
jgi:hypothetical protein